MATLIEISQSPGVADLPLKVRGKFALAIKAEMEGDHEKAERLLNEAVAAEEALKTAA